LGRPMVLNDERAGNNHVVWLADALWRSRFHQDRAVIGATLRLNEEPFVIAGVLPPFRFPMRASIPDLYFPLDERDYARQRGGGGIEAIARLRPNVPIQTARADLQTAAAGLAQAFPASNRNYDAGLRSLREQLTGNRAAPLWLLFGAAGLLFAITAVNVANLLIARAIARSHETSIRLSLGASAGKLLQQRLVEAGLLAILSAFAAFGMAAVLGTVKVDWRTYAFAGLLAALTTLGFGLIPVPSRAHRQSLVRRVLVTAEIALSFSLLLATALMLHGLWNTLQVSPGFDPREVLTVGIGLPEVRYNTDAKMADFYEQAIARLAATPRVEIAAGGAWLPMAGEIAFRYQREDRPLEKAQRPVAYGGNASPSYFSALRIPVLRGREFSPQDRIGHAAVCVINHALAQAAFPGEDPIGKRLMLDFFNTSYPKGTLWQIVGIAADSHQVSLEQAPLPQVFVPLYQVPPDGLRFVLRTPASALELTPAVRAAIAGVDPNLEELTPGPLSRFIERSLAGRRWAALLLAGFALVALLVTALGLFALIAFNVARRSKEIGVRMAVGASPRSIHALVLSEGVALLLCGLIAGVALSFGMLRVFGHLLPLPAGDLLSQCSAALVLFLSGLLACWLPSRRAGRMDPLKVLRAE
jgi:putative ABC transport system permease protein